MVEVRVDVRVIVEGRDATDLDEAITLLQDTFRELGDDMGLDFKVDVGEPTRAGSRPAAQ